jgi:hypothetical protein
MMDRPAEEQDEASLLISKMLILKWKRSPKNKTNKSHTESNGFVTKLWIIWSIPWQQTQINYRLPQLTCKMSEKSINIWLVLSVRHTM